MEAIVAGIEALAPFVAEGGRLLEQYRAGHDPAAIAKALAENHAAMASAIADLEAAHQRHNAAADEELAK